LKTGAGRKGKDPRKSPEKIRRCKKKIGAEK
jgi:hypothetical protein